MNRRELMTGAAAAALATAIPLPVLAAATPRSNIVLDPKIPMSATEILERQRESYAMLMWKMQEHVKEFDHPAIDRMAVVLNDILVREMEKTAASIGS